MHFGQMVKYVDMGSDAAGVQADLSAGVVVDLGVVPQPLDCSV